MKLPPGPSLRWRQHRETGNRLRKVARNLQDLTACPSSRPFLQASRLKDASVACCLASSAVNRVTGQGPSLARSAPKTALFPQAWDVLRPVVISIRPRSRAVAKRSICSAMGIKAHTADSIYQEEGIQLPSCHAGPPQGFRAVGSGPAPDIPDG